MALYALQEEGKPLEPKVSLPKTKVQVFGGLLDKTVLSMHVTKTLRSGKTLHSLVIKYITTVV